ncbi:MAG: hypothetical protein JXB40_06445 [Candidatus Omnitrophica bacterium]|nr:hypothetical protein [Candidatus Omnitrophota bacterium]
MICNDICYAAPDIAKHLAVESMFKPTTRDDRSSGFEEAIAAQYAKELTEKYRKIGVSDYTLIPEIERHTAAVKHKSRTKKASKPSLTAPISCAKYQDAIIGIITSKDYPEEKINLKDLFAYIKERHPKLLETGANDREKLAILCLSLYGSGNTYWNILDLLKGNTATANHKKAALFRKIKEEVEEKLRSLQDVILPDNRTTAFAIAEYFKYGYDNLDPKRQELLKNFFRICKNPKKRNFAGQWERDYAEILSKMSARQLQAEWERVGALIEYVNLPLYTISVRECVNDTVQYFHPQYYTLFDILSSEDEIERYLVCYIAKMAIILEWAGRHWMPGRESSGFSSLPKKIKPSFKYIKSTINASLLNVKDKILKFEDRPVYKTLSMLSDEKARSILNNLQLKMQRDIDSEIMERGRTQSEPAVSIQGHKPDGTFKRKPGGSFKDTIDIILDDSYLYSSAKKGNLTIPQYLSVDQRVASSTKKRDFAKLVELGYLRLTNNLSKPYKYAMTDLAISYDLCRAHVDLFLDLCPDYPDDTASIHNLIRMTIGAGYEKSAVLFARLESMLEDDIISVKDVPNLVYLLSANTSYDPAIDETILIIWRMFKRRYIERNDIGSFLRPICERTVSTRRYAIYGIFHCFEAGLSKDEIRRILMPVAEVGSEESGLFIITIGDLLKSRAINKEDVAELFIPFIRIVKRNADNTRLLIANLHRMLTLERKWTPDEFVRFVLPVIETCGRNTCTILGAICGLVEHNAVTKEEAYRYLMPFAMMLEEHTGPTLSLLVDDVIMPSSRGMGYDYDSTTVDFDIGSMAAMFRVFSQRHRDHNVDDATIKRELIAPAIGKAIGMLNKIISSGRGSERFGTVSVLKLKEVLSRTLSQLPEYHNPANDNIINELFKADITGPRRLELLSSPTLIGDDKARKALEAELLHNSSLESKARLAILQALLDTGSPESMKTLTQFIAITEDSAAKNRAVEVRTRLTGVDYSLIASSDKHMPPGSIYSVLKYLCDNGITSGEKAVSRQDLVAAIGRKYNTLKYDLRALYRHLHLVVKEGRGEYARYYVPENVRNKSSEILPVLTRFRREELRPSPDILEDVYRNEIEPIIGPLEETHEAALDSKNRITVPRAFASAMSVPFFLIPVAEERRIAVCAFEWLMNKIKPFLSAIISDSANRAVLRAIGSRSELVNKLEKGGRFVMSPEMLGAIGAGNGNRRLLITKKNGHLEIRAAQNRELLQKLSVLGFTALGYAIASMAEFNPNYTAILLPLLGSCLNIHTESIDNEALTTPGDQRLLRKVRDYLLSLPLARLKRITAPTIRDAILGRFGTAKNFQRTFWTNWAHRIGFDLEKEKEAARAYEGKIAAALAEKEKTEKGRWKKADRFYKGQIIKYVGTERSHLIGKKGSIIGLPELNKEGQRVPGVSVGYRTRRGIETFTLKEAQKDLRVRVIGKLPAVPNNLPDRHVNKDFGRFTSMYTHPGRLINIDNLIMTLLDKEIPYTGEKPLIGDLGVGFPPVTTVELAEKLGNRADVVGVDITIPKYAVKMADDLVTGPYYTMFDEHDNYLGGFGENTTKINEEQKQRALEARDAFLQPEAPEADKNGNKILRDPMPRYQRDNLTFIRGGFDFKYDKQFDIIRTFNVLVPEYYGNAAEVERALQAIGSHLKEGGLLIAGTTHASSGREEFLIYKKSNGKLVPKYLGTFVGLKLGAVSTIKTITSGGRGNSAFLKPCAGILHLLSNIEYHVKLDSIYTGYKYKMKALEAEIISAYFKMSSGFPPEEYRKLNETGIDETRLYRERVASLLKDRYGYKATNTSSGHIIFELDPDGKLSISARPSEDTGDGANSMTKELIAGGHKACEDCDKAMNYARLAKAEAQRGDINKAKEFAEMAVKLFPANGTLFGAVSALMPDQTISMDARIDLCDVLGNHIKRFGVSASLPISIIEDCLKIKEAPLKRDAFNKIIEPLFFKAPELFDDTIVRRIVAHYRKEAPQAKYLLFYASMRRGPPLYIDKDFPIHSLIKNRLSHGKKKILFVYNLMDGMGDELITGSMLMQALLDFNPELEISIHTPRPYLYSHPRVYAKHITEIILPQEKFDVVIHASMEGEMLKAKHGSDVIAYLQSHPDSFYIELNKHPNSRASSMAVKNDKLIYTYFDGNRYSVGTHIAAELGLPFRHGTIRPGRDLFITEKMPEVEAYFNVINTANKNGLPILVINPFGGEFSAKGPLNDTEIGHFRAIIKTLIDRGCFVVIATNDQPWGSADEAAKIIAGLPEKNIHILPLPNKIPHLYKHIVDRSSGVITVEGGMAHLAYHMGKPLIVFIMKGSGRECEWIPFTADRLQGTARSHDFGAEGEIDVINDFVDHIKNDEGPRFTGDSIPESDELAKSIRMEAGLASDDPVNIIKNPDTLIEIKNDAINRLREAEKFKELTDVALDDKVSPILRKAAIKSMEIAGIDLAWNLDDKTSFEEMERIISILKVLVTKTRISRDPKIQALLCKEAVWALRKIGSQALKIGCDSISAKTSKILEELAESLMAEFGIAEHDKIAAINELLRKTHMKIVIGAVAEERSVGAAKKFINKMGWKGNDKSLNLMVARYFQNDSDNKESNSYFRDQFSDFTICTYPIPSEDCLTLTFLDVNRIRDLAVNDYAIPDNFAEEGLFNKVVDVAILSTLLIAKNEQDKAKTKAKQDEFGEKELLDIANDAIILSEQVLDKKPVTETERMEFLALGSSHITFRYNAINGKQYALLINYQKKGDKHTYASHESLIYKAINPTGERKDLPYIVRKYTHNGRTIYIQELFAPGKTLEEAQEKLSGWTDRQKAALALKIARILSYLHSKGVLHRDLCPPNIWIPDALMNNPDMIDTYPPIVFDFVYSLLMNTRDGRIESGLPKYYDICQQFTIYTPGYSYLHSRSRRDKLWRNPRKDLFGFGTILSCIYNIDTHAMLGGSEILNTKNKEFREIVIRKHDGHLKKLRVKLPPKEKKLVLRHIHIFQKDIDALIDNSGIPYQIRVLMKGLIRTNNPEEINLTIDDIIEGLKNTLEMRAQTEKGWGPGTPHITQPADELLEPESGTWIEPQRYIDTAKQARRFISKNKQRFWDKGLRITTCEGHTYETMRRLTENGISSRATYRRRNGKHHVWLETSDGYIIDAYPQDGGLPRIFKREMAPANRYNGNDITNFAWAVRDIQKWNDVAQKIEAGYQNPASSPLPSGEFEKIQAIRLIDTAKLIESAKSDKPVIMALGTDWIKSYEPGEPQYSDINPLVTSIRNLCRKRGMIFIDGSDEDLPEKINDARKVNPNARVVVLAGQEAILSRTFEELRSDTNTFLAAVDSSKLDKNCYIRIVEMIRIALWMGLNINDILSDSGNIMNNPNITIYRYGESRTIYIFAPKPERIPIDSERRSLYKVQEFA